ncbi:MAG: DUF502 domain-containing protein [Planctomycetota bacterium]
MTRFFLRGLVTLAPVVLTIVVFGLLYQMVDRYVTSPINAVIYWVLEKNTVGWKALSVLQIDPLAAEYLDPGKLPIDLQAQSGAEGLSPAVVVELETLRAEKSSFFKDFDDLAIDGDKLRKKVVTVVHPFVGIVLSLLLVLWLGWIVGGFVGRRIVARLDQAMQAIPVVRSVYPYSKQLVEFFFAEKKLEFDTVVCLPYPSPGLWSLGFVTSNALKTLREETGDRLISVFVPSSPVPMTGYTIFVAYDRVIPLPITVDEAARIIMTGGVLVPSRERVEDSLLTGWGQAKRTIDGEPPARPTASDDAGAIAGRADDPAGADDVRGAADPRPAATEGAEAE